MNSYLCVGMNTVELIQYIHNEANAISADVFTMLNLNYVSQQHMYP